MYLILDGHPSHHCPKDDVRSLIKCDALKPLFLPPGTSWFNSAEWVNSAVKRSLKKHFALMDYDPPKYADFKRLIDEHLVVIRERLTNSRLFLANLEELHRAKNAP